MKRSTINQIRLNEPVRSLKKNRSCQLNNKIMGRCFKENNKNNRNQFISMTVANLFIHQLLDQLTQTFRSKDQDSFHQQLFYFIDSAQHGLGYMLNPIILLQQDGSNDLIQCQSEPKNVNGDLMCGGNTIPCQTRSRIVPRVSLNLHQEISKKQKNQFSNSKQAISSKCQIKMKDQLQQIKNGFQSLQKQGIKDSNEDILRDKFIKDKNLQYKKQLQNERPVMLPLIEQHSFDYDGAIFPIKKNSVQNVNKIKILNTTCRVIDRGIADNKKQNVIPKLKGGYLKTQTSQNQKQTKRFMEKQQQRALFLRRQSNTESMKDLLRICTEGESNIKAKIEQSMYNKSIKIRQIKLA